MRSPGSLPTALTAKHLHGVAANLRLRLGWDIGVAHLVHPFKLQFSSAARASHHRDWHRLRRRRAGIAARRGAMAESSLPGFPPGTLELTLSHGIDNSSSLFGSENDFSQPDDGRNLKAERGTAATISAIASSMLSPWRRRRAGARRS